MRRGAIGDYLAELSNGQYDPGHLALKALAVVDIASLA
jgi:hypothetical protein